MTKFFLSKKLESLVIPDHLTCNWALNGFENLIIGVGLKTTGHLRYLCFMILLLLCKSITSLYIEEVRKSSDTRLFNMYLGFENLRLLEEISG